MSSDKFLRVQPPKGTRDLFENDFSKIEFISSILFRRARSYGFGRIDIPVFEHLDVFNLTSPVNPEKCYIFSDKAGRDLILRPDINAPISRLVVNNFSSAQMPLRFFFSDKVFRYRNSARREFRMFGLETYGIAEPIADAEILRVVADIIEEVGFPGYEIEYSNLRIYDRFINEVATQYGLSINIDELLYNLRLSSGPDKMAILLASYGLPADVVKLLMSMLFCPSEDIENYKVLKNIAHHSVALQEELDKTVAFREALTDYHLSKIRFNISNLHGSGFYSGFTYRVTPSGCDQEIADGGRYDTFTELLGGKSIPATGIGFGVERLIRFAESRGLNVSSTDSLPPILVIFKGREEAIKLRPMLKTARSSGLLIEEEIYKRKKDKTIRYAKSKGCRLAVFVSYTGGYPEKIELEIFHLSGVSKTENIIIENAEMFSEFLTKRL